MSSAFHTRLRRYTVAIGAVAMAVLLVWFYPPFKERGAFVLLLGAVSLATWYGGLWPGIVAIGLAAVTAAYYILPPADSVYITNLEDLIRLGLFLMIALLIGSLHEARARAERSLARSQERMQFALDQARMGVWDANVRTGEFWRSPNLPSIYGHDEGNFATSYESLFAYTVPEDQDRVNQAVTSMLEDGIEFEVRHRVSGADGRVRQLATRCLICLDDKGKIERMVGVTSGTVKEPFSPPAPEEKGEAEGGGAKGYQVR